MIRQLEEISLNAWPALQTLLYDGWVIRLADGYTKRANSVNPLYPSELDVAEKIAACEKIYRDNNLPVVFKLTTDCCPHDLDTVLATNGYATDSDTSVQLLSLQAWNTGVQPDVNLETALSDGWLAAFCRMSKLDDQRRIKLERILNLIAPAKCFASVQVAGQIAACGLGVAQAGFVGLFDIVTDANLRGKGYGQCVVEEILAWGKAQGAHTAYLQVMLNNGPALSLYAKLGFQEAYRYWYRIKV